MGLSSSQARLLNLTQRMHQIEYKAQKLEAEKLQMANESDKVYQTYLDALEQTKVQYKILTTDGSTTYQDIPDYATMVAAGYAIQYNGITYDNKTDETGNIFQDASNNTYVKAGDGIVVKKDGTNWTSYPNIFHAAPSTDTTIYPVYKNGVLSYAAAPLAAGSVNIYKGDASTTADSTKDSVTLSAGNKGLALLAAQLKITDYTDNSTLLTNIIKSGKVTLVSAKTDGTFAQPNDKDFNVYETSVATNTGLQEVDDTINLKKAEAQYEADMKKIDRKDSKYDSDISALETERNAIKTEMETLKTVAKDNVERTFKLFS